MTLHHSSYNLYSMAILTIWWWHEHTRYKSIICLQYMCNIDNRQTSRGWFTAFLHTSISVCQCRTRNSVQSPINHRVPHLLLIRYVNPPTILKNRLNTPRSKRCMHLLDTICTILFTICTSLRSSFSKVHVVTIITTNYSDINHVNTYPLSNIKWHATKILSNIT